MAKKKAAAQSKAAAKAAKKAKAAQKVERKEKKKRKDDSDADSDDDLEFILDKMRREWEEANAVTEETVEGPPSRRANATFTPCPNGNHLWCVGGEYFDEEGKAHFYNDVYRYSPEKDEWRKFTSPTCPGPRSAHAVAATPASGGKLFLFGGEFSSLHQTTFHHYRDFWSFDISSHTWERIETKVKPSARSGCRMAFWKHFLVLFGGFYDPGIRTNYLNDLWLFDTQEYTWKQVEFGHTDRRPSPRSGFSFIPAPDGIILHGGYCKEYVKGKRAIGISLEDTWLLHMNTDPNLIKWERRKKAGYSPSVRSGCTMAFWTAKNMGILFGGVFDEDKGEEGLKSLFYNDLYGYQVTGNGRWVSMNLRKAKKPKGAIQRKKAVPVSAHHALSDEEDIEGDPERTQEAGANPATRAPVAVEEKEEVDPDDPSPSIPFARYNAMLAVLRNTLYIYGGIYESKSREYTLDDFYALQLDKMDRFVCLKESQVVIGEQDESSSDEDDDQEDSDEEEGSDDEGEKENEEDDGEDDDDGRVGSGSNSNNKAGASQVQQEPETPIDAEDLRKRANAFIGLSTDASARSAEDSISTPLPGETLAVFYSRSREYWAQKALGSSDNRGKMLRKDGFSLAQERYASYKPILDEVQKILAEAGLDEEEMKRVGGPSKSGDAASRNRR